MTRRATLRRRGHFEMLEERQLLAGDVVVSVVGGEMQLQGDALDNKIMITAGAVANSFVIKGLDGTTVHKTGEAPGSEVTVTDVRSARAELGDGHDLVAMVGAELRGRLYVDTEAGNDRVRIGTGGGDAELDSVLPANVAVTLGSLYVDTGVGDDRISVDKVQVYGLAAVESGADNDTVDLGGTGASMFTGPGVSESDAQLRLRAGIYVDLGAGNDTLNMDRVHARGAVAANGGSGDNTVNADHTSSAVFGVYSEGGVDTVSLKNMQAHLAGAYTGGGSDRVDVRDSVFSSIGVVLGDGDDVLSVAGAKARHAVFLGGPGQDTYLDQGSNDWMTKIIRQFEVPPDINTPPPPRRPGPWLFGRLI